MQNPKGNLYITHVWWSSRVHFVALLEVTAGWKWTGRDSNAFFTHTQHLPSPLPPKILAPRVPVKRKTGKHRLVSRGHCRRALVRHTSNDRRRWHLDFHRTAHTLLISFYTLCTLYPHRKTVCESYDANL